METTALEQIMFEAYKASRLIEFVMEKLRESGTMLFDPEEVSVNDQSMGDLMRRRNKLFQKVENKLLDHKLHPVIDPGHRELIIRVAGELLHDTDTLENRLRKEFENNINDFVQRYKDLNIFFLNAKPRKLVLNRLKEAFECYVHGYFQGCAVLCRTVLETAIKEKLRPKVEKIPKIPMGPLLKMALKLNIVSKDEYEKGLKVKTVGDNSIHSSTRCSAKEAFESLCNTKFLLSEIYE